MKCTHTKMKTWTAFAILATVLYCLYKSILKLISYDKVSANAACSEPKIKCKEITQNTQILKIADFVIYWAPDLIRSH